MKKKKNDIIILETLHNDICNTRKRELTVKKKFKNAFSLMEMMVVLLIVAIIAAATAPMMSKKLSENTAAGGSPWVFSGLGNSIAYNMSGSDSSAIIGALTYTPGENGPKHPRLVLASGDANHPALAFANSSGVFTSQMDLNSSTGAVKLNDSAVGNDSIAIGFGQTIGDDKTGVVVIGAKASSNSNNTVVIGNNATATGSNAVSIGSDTTKATNASNYSVAIGTGAEATGNSSGRATAVGYDAKATGYNSTAIGAGATATASNQIVLGTASDTVYIPGNLIAKGTILLGSYLHDTYIYTNHKDDGHAGYNIMYRADQSTSHTVWESRSNKGPSTLTLSGENFTVYSSDRRLKNVGEKYTAGLEELKKLDFYHYTFKKDETKAPQVGVMAQDLQKVFPDAVIKGDDGYLKIRLEDMFYAVINAVKELDTKICGIVSNITDIKATIESQQKTIDSLKEENAELKNEIKEIQKRIDKLEK